MPSVFYQLIPLSPQSYKADAAGVLVSPVCFFDEQTEAQREGESAVTQPAMAGPGLPTMRVRQGWERSQVP